MRRAVSGTWSRLYFEALANMVRATERGTISEDEFRRRIAAIDEWLRDRNLAIVADCDDFKRHGVWFVLNPRTQ